MLECFTRYEIYKVSWNRVHNGVQLNMALNVLSESFLSNCQISVCLPCSAPSALLYNLTGQGLTKGRAEVSQLYPMAFIKLAGTMSFDKVPTLKSFDARKVTPWFIVRSHAA